MMAHTNTRPGTVHAALVAVQVFFGIQYLAAKVLLQEIPPPVWALIRVVAAAVLLLLLVGFSGRRLPREPSVLWRLALFSVFGVSMNQFLFVNGLDRTTPGHAAIIMTGIPVATLAFGILLGRERWRAVKGVAVTISLAGVLLVIGPGAVEQPGASWLGDLLVFTNGSFYAFFLVISKSTLDRLDSLSATTLLFVFGSVVLIVLAGPSLAGFDIGAVSARTWWLGLYIVLFPTVGAYLLTVWALARVESSLVALFIYLQPLIATALSVALLGERPGALTIAGAALVFLGVFVAVRGGRRGGSSVSSGRPRPPSVG